LRNFPVPESPGFNRSGVHLTDVVTIGEFSKLGILSPIIFTEFVSSLIGINIISFDWWSYGENTSSPSIVI